VSDDNPETGNFSTYSGVGEACESGSPTYRYDLGVNGQTNGQSGVEPGDTVVTSMFQTGTTEEAEVHDLTNGEYWYSDSSPVPDSSVAIGAIGIAPCGDGFCIPDFGKLTFSNVQVDGDYFAFEPRGAYDEWSGQTKLITTPSSPPAPGDSFKLTFKATSGAPRTPAARRLSNSQDALEGSGTSRRGGEAPLQPESSAVFAGYSTSPNAGYASTSATFTIPKLSCTSGTEPLDVGVSDQDPTGTAARAMSAINLACNGSNAVYKYMVAIGAQVVFERGAKAGDTVVASMFQTGSVEEAEIHDLTNGQYWYADSSPLPDSIASIGTFRADECIRGGACANPDFGVVTFSDVLVNGDYLSFEAPGQFDQEGTNTFHQTVYLTKTSSIEGPGDAFSLTFKNGEV
jgi:hypothetical protein